MSGPAEDRRRPNAGTPPAIDAADPADALLEPREADAVDRVVRVVLGAGLIASSLLLIAGFVAWALNGGDIPVSVHGPIAAARESARLEPMGFFSLGLLLLILTPFARVIGTVVVFLRLHDWRYGLVSLGVLAAMVTAVLIAIF
jgi:uncharacterized membrane protein